MNICHGNAGHGWNSQTVDRSALKEGHAGYEHNLESKNKRPDYFPGSISVPNPNGAGNKGHIDDNCGWVADEEEPVVDEPEPAEEEPVRQDPMEEEPQYVEPDETEYEVDEPEPPAEEEESVAAVGDPIYLDEPEPEYTEPEYIPAYTPEPKKPASTFGDPHFKTWSGEKFDYHGECDLVMVDNPSFANGLGLRVHIRTARVSYFSYISDIAVQIGDETLEFSNDVTNFLLNGEPAEPIRKWHETKISGFVVRRDPKAISIRLNQADPQHPGAKIDLVARRVGFPAIVLNGAGSDIFKGSLGMLGDFETGKKIARDGKTEIEDPTEFALEWQVRDTEPMIFRTARFPQYPTQCTPPKKMMTNRLGMSHMLADAEKACASWKEDKESCIFDVIATRDILMAEGGSVVG
mgnify:CR=1 FL=1